MVKKALVRMLELTLKASSGGTDLEPGASFLHGTVTSN